MTIRNDAPFFHSRSSERADCVVLTCIKTVNKISLVSKSYCVIHLATLVFIYNLQIKAFNCVQNVRTHA